MTIRLVVISDDFTGGLMVASHLERMGIACPYLANPDALPAVGDQEAVVIATRMRFVPARAAVASLRSITDALDRIGVQQICYKYCATFDSTDEGNIGPCADALMEKYRLDRLIFSPGFPDFRIFVHEGYMHYKDRLISESIKRFDPITPMSDPDMARVLQRQTARKVGLLPHRILYQGLPAARAWVDEQAASGVQYFMADSVDNDDIDRTAELVLDSPVVTGGDALPIGLARLHRGHGGALVPPTSPVRHVAGAGAVLAGSCGIATLEQLAHFEKSHPVLRIDLLEAADDPRVVERSAAWAAEQLGKGPVGVTTAAEPDAVKKAQAKLGVMDAARRAEEILAGIAVQLRKRGVRRFVVSGGETAGAIVTALGVRRMQVAPFDSLGAGNCVAVDPEPLSFFLKPGKIGTPDVFSRALNVMDGRPA